jgi:uncharacterized protein YbjT (DUF2867 family)
MMERSSVRVLVTGATGTLGRHVVGLLEQRAATSLRILSRRERPSEPPASRDWFRADLLDGALEPALRDVDVVLHLASAKGAGDADVLATRRLLAAAEVARVRHLVLISIIGCDAIPLPYYASKLQIEAAVRSCGVPWSVVRVAQFHSFVDRLVRTPATLPVPSAIVTDLRFQPVDEREVAGRLVEVALGPPAGDAPELAGPEVLTLGEIAATWFTVTGRPATLVPVTVDMLAFDAATPGPAPWTRAVLEGYRAALNTPHGRRTLGKIRYADWLRERAEAGRA